MRFKLDENMPATAATPLRVAGHDVDTVLDEGLSGASDKEVAAAAVEAGRIVVTLDRGFGDIRAYPPGTHAGILVIRPPEQSPVAVRDAVAALVAAVDLAEFAGCVVVYRNGSVRVRRPPR